MGVQGFNEKHNICAKEVRKREDTRLGHEYHKFLLIRKCGGPMVMLEDYFVLQISLSSKMLGFFN